MTFVMFDFVPLPNPLRRRGNVHFIFPCVLVPPLGLRCTHKYFLEIQLQIFATNTQISAFTKASKPAKAWNSCNLQCFFDF
jgi:hypothetical protein